MWICHNKGFLSVVQYDEDPEMLLVRARRKADMEAIFPGKKIHVTRNRDYRYRLICTRQEISDLVHGMVSEIDYPNFKKSVQDPDLHQLYGDMWFTHWMYQDAEPGHKKRYRDRAKLY